MQGTLVLTEMEVDEQELPEPKAEETSANVEAQSSIKLLEKLATNIKKLDANVEKLISAIAKIKANQLIIINILSHCPKKLCLCFNDNFY